MAQLYTIEQVGRLFIALGDEVLVSRFIQGVSKVVMYAERV